jgi:hypothetical protein
MNPLEVSEMSTSKAKAASFKSLSKVMLVIARIAIWACFILAGGLAIASIVIAFVPKGDFGVIKGSYELGQGAASFLSFKAATPAEGISIKAALLAGFTALMPFCFWGGFFFLPISRILESITKGRPFDPLCAGFLRKLALCVALYPVAGWACQGFALSVLKAFAVPMNGFNFGFSYDPTMLVFAALLFILSGVFKYGEELQRDADGTV